MRYKDQATTVFSEIADVIESSDNAENNIYDIVDFKFHAHSLISKL